MTEPEEKPPHQDQASDDAGKSNRVLGLSFEALSLIFDGIIAIAAIVGSVFVYRQLISMNSQLVVMREQMKDARAAAKSADVTTDRQLKIAESQAASLAKLADASKVSADNSDRIARGSEAAVDGAQSAMRLDQRAWIGVQDSSNGLFTDKSFTTPSIDVAIVNTGKTPAFVDICSELVLIAGPPDQVTGPRPSNTLKPFWVDHPNDCPMHRVSRNLVTHRGQPPQPITVGGENFNERPRYVSTIDPGQTAKLTVRPDDDDLNIHYVTTQLVEEIDTNWSKLFVTVRANYTDIFGRKHKMLYCGQWKPPSDKLTPCPGIAYYSD